MNSRFCSVIAVITLMMLTTGCSGARNFFFGRGARCGSLAPRFGNTMQAPAGQAPCHQSPCGQSPYVAAPGQPCTSCQSTPADCGCNTCTGSVGYGSAYGCTGGCTTQMGTPVVTDPYMTGGIVEGPVISDTIVGGTTSVPGTIQSDDFRARNQFDTDGNRILWEEPLPSGANQL